jgi:hypothetical protein
VYAWLLWCSYRRATHIEERFSSALKQPLIPLHHPPAASTHPVKDYPRVIVSFLHPLSSRGSVRIGWTILRSCCLSIPPTRLLPAPASTPLAALRLEAKGGSRRPRQRQHRWRPPRRADGGRPCSAAASLPWHGGSPWTRYRNGYAPFSRLLSPLVGRILDRIEPVAGASDPRQHVRVTSDRTPIKVYASVLPRPEPPQPRRM